MRGGDGSSRVSIDAMKRLLAVSVVLGLVLAGCNQGDVQDLVDDAESALRDAGQQLEELANSGPVRDAAERARDAAEDARQAAEDFRENPGDETRQALNDASAALQDATEELRQALDDAPENVKSGFQDALDALTDLRRNIEQELEGG